MTNFVNAPRTRLTLAAVACLFALNGCSYIVGPPTTIDPGEEPSPPYHSAEDAIQDAKEYDSLDSPLVIKPGEVVAVRLDRSHPSVGHAYELATEPTEGVVAAEVKHKSDDPSPKPGGDAGTSYLVLTGVAPGQEKVAVTYCWRDRPNSAGVCEQDSAPKQERMLKGEVTVEVK